MYLFETIKYFSDVLIGTSLLFICVLLYRYFFSQRFSSIYNRKKYTLELCLSDHRIYEKLIRKRERMPYYKQIEAEFDMDSEIVDELNDIFSFFEKISIGITERIYDEKIIRAYYEKYFILFYDFYKFYLLRYRDEYKLPFLYIEYEKYVKKWQSETISNYKRRIKNEW